MKLHGNAALSWRGRQRLAKRVVVEGWTLAAALGRQPPVSRTNVLGSYT
jgi:hypothetical protein